MRNFSQKGNVLTLTAPYAVATGGGMLVGTLFAVATGAASSGAQVEAMTEGVFTLPAASADTPAQGAAAYWDNAAKVVTTVVGSNRLIGYFAAAKGAGVTSAQVLVSP